MKFLSEILLFIVILLLVVFGASFLVMVLWNAVIPQVFNLPILSFSQALMLLVLSRLLFSSGSVSTKSK